MDLLIKNVRLGRPGFHAVETRDLGVADGRFTRVEPVIDAALTREVFDARGQLGFPVVVDAHTHVGIYAPLRDDAVTESQTAAGPTRSSTRRSSRPRATATGATTRITSPRSRLGTSTRWSGSPPGRACPRSRSSCPTAATGFTAGRIGTRSAAFSWIAGYLAHETECPGINLLDLSSRKAMEAAVALPRVFPHLDVRREVTATLRARMWRRALRRGNRVGRARAGRPFIHSYPQGFPHPQPTHILWITGRWPPTHGGDPVSSEAEKVHVDWGLRFD